MNTNIDFVNGKIKKGLIFWTIKPSSSNSTGTSYVPDADNPRGDVNDSLEQLAETVEALWEYNYEPLIVTLRKNANATGHKEGPFRLIPDDYAEPEPEPERPVSRGVSGVTSGGGALTPAQMEKAGYVPIELMRLEIRKLEDAMELDRRRRLIDDERREWRRQREIEEAEIAAKHAQVDSWGNKATKVLGVVTSNKELMGNLGAIGLQSVGKAFGIKPEQLETLGAALFDEAPAVKPDATEPMVRPVDIVSGVTDAEFSESGGGGGANDDDLREKEEEILDVIVEADMPEAVLDGLLIGVKKFIKSYQENATNATDATDNYTDSGE
jgi:hypothetical protein